MVSPRLLVLFGSLLASSVLAAPVSNVNGIAKRAAFVAKAYADFQISDGTAGNAEAQANAVFVDPFNGVDLSTIDSATIDALSAMREAAENAETADFNPAIAAASGAAADALQNGKIKNKVLKLTGLVQIDKIKIAVAKAKGTDASSAQTSLDDEQTKLTKNISLDVAAKGQASKGVA